MRLRIPRPTVAVIMLWASLSRVQAVQQDLSIHDIKDPTLHDELLQLGGYQELVQEFGSVSLVPVPLVKAADLGLEFRATGVRVQVEVLPFVPDIAPKEGPVGWELDGHPMIGWTPGGEHTRMARLELVQEGAVCGPAPARWLDVFDAPLLVNGVPYVAVMRSRDGWRTYLHLQAGEGPWGRMVTWVFEDGALLCRLVDQAPLW
jgi:hypothetical protein